MQKLFNDFLNNSITSNELVLKLKKLSRYPSYKDLNNLITDINNIINNKIPDTEYEEVLMVFYQYLNNRKHNPKI